MFTKSKIKRFNEIGSCAPPVGSYNVGDDTKKHGSCAMTERSKRFGSGDKEKGSYPAPFAVPDVSFNLSRIHRTSSCSTPASFMKSKNAISASTPNLFSRSSSKSNCELETEDLQIELKKSQDRNEEVESQIETLRCDNNKMRETHNDLRESINVMRKTYKEALEQYMLNKDSYQVTFVTLRRLTDNVIEKNEEYKMSTQKLAEENNSLRDERNGLLAQLEKLVADAKKRQEEYTRSMVELHMNCNSVMKKVTGFKDHFVDVKTQLDSFEDTYSQIMKSKEDDRHCNDQQKIEILQLEGKNLDLEEKVMALQQDVDEKQSKLELKVALCNQLQSDLESSRQELLSTKSSLLDLSSEVETLELNWQMKYSQLEDCVSCLQNENDLEKEKSCCLQEINDELQQSYKSIAEKLAASNDAIVSLTEELNSNEMMMTDNMRGITQKYESMEEGMALLKETCSKKEVVLKKELEATKQSYITCKNDLTSLQSSYQVQQKSAMEGILQLESKDRAMEVLRDQCCGLQDDLKSLRADKSTASLEQDITFWKEKYENLEMKIGPFQDCLDQFNLERKMLIEENSGKQEEIASLAHRYAEILGHQNNKQKIRHLIKLKEDSMVMKQEISKLKLQASKDKATIKKLQGEGVAEKRPKQFNKQEAFRHALANKENCTNSS